MVAAAAAGLLIYAAVTTMSSAAEPQNRHKKYDTVEALLGDGVSKKNADTIRKLVRGENRSLKANDFQKACAFNTKLGNAFMDLSRQGGMPGAFSWAESTWRRGSTIKDCDHATWNYGNVMRNTDRPAEAFQFFTRAFHLSRAENSTSKKQQKNFIDASKVALKFSGQQLELLLDEGRLPDTPARRQEVAHYSDMLSYVPEGAPIELRPDDVAAIPSYRRDLYIAHQPALEGGAIAKRSPAEVAELERTYHRDSVVVIDDVLTPEALKGLHEFASRSTIYTDDKPKGYVGSYMEDGFYTPLLEQAANELRAYFSGRQFLVVVSLSLLTSNGCCSAELLDEGIIKEGMAAIDPSSVQ
jgi:hypothetical protein